MHSLIAANLIRELGTNLEITPRLSEVFAGVEFAPTPMRASVRPPI